MEHHERRRVNGVFKGGGAKGVAYAGALQACEDAGVEFEAVAGASAGAIAAALVACRYPAEELAPLLESALSTLPSPARALVAFHRSSVFDPTALERWIEHTLRRRLDVPDTRPVTFGDIVTATGIDLFVVAMDLSSRQPVVFSGSLSPTAHVAASIAASAAIPVAFPPVRVVSTTDVHRLVDGGTFANYPSFVFDDHAFRSFHGLPPTTVPILGFALEDGPSERPLTSRNVVPLRRSRLATDRGALARDGGAIGQLISSPAFRLAGSLSPIVLCLTVATFVIAETSSGLGGLRWIPHSVLDSVLIALVFLTAMGIALGVTVALTIARLGRDIFDVGVMGARAALGVGPSVPYWVGTAGVAAAHGHTTVRIRAPSELSTLTFDAPRGVVDVAIASGYAATARALGLGSALVDTDSALDPAAGDERPTRRDHPHHESSSELRPRAALRAWMTGRNVAWATIVPILVMSSMFFLVSAVEKLHTSEHAGAAGFTGLAIVAAAAAVRMIVRHKVQQQADPYPLLGSLPPRLLMVCGVASLAITLVPLIPADGPSISALLAATRVEGQVARVTGSSTPVTVDVVFSTRSIEGMRFPLPAYTNDGLWECPLTTPTRDRTCYRFRSSTSELTPGQTVTVAVDPDRDVSHVIADQWLITFGTARTSLVLLGVSALIASYHFLRAFRWRRDRARTNEIRRFLLPPLAPEVDRRSGE